MLSITPVSYSLAPQARNGEGVGDEKTGMVGCVWPVPGRVLWWAGGAIPTSSREISGPDWVRRIYPSHETGLRNLEARGWGRRANEWQKNYGAKYSHCHRQETGRQRITWYGAGRQFVTNTINQYSIEEEEWMTTNILELQGHTEQNFSFYQGTGYFDPSKVASIKSLTLPPSIWFVAIGALIVISTWTVLP